MLKSRPRRGTLPCTTATVTAGSPPDPAPACRTCGQTTMAPSSTRHTEMPGSNTAGGGGGSAALMVAGAPPRHHLTISSAIAVAQLPTSTTDAESRATPPSWTSGSNGPSAWLKATDPQGKPPNGTIDFNHSCAAHTTANQIGQPGSRRTTTANRPKRPGNSAHIIASANQGMTPTSVLTHGSNSR